MPSVGGATSIIGSTPVVIARPVTPAALIAAWKGRNLGGQYRHQLVVRVRPGYMKMLYQPYTFLDDNALTNMPVIWQGYNDSPWQGQWTPTGAWVTVPEIVSCKVTNSLSDSSGGSNDNGISTATIVMDDVAFKDTQGLSGLYHTIERGYFSPQRGVKVNSRPARFTLENPQTGWTDVLNGGYQVEVWEGYGPDGDPSVTPLAEPTNNGTCVPFDNPGIARTWTGLIEQCDIDSHPDQMTITARDFGCFLTDQRIIYQNKAPEIRSPVTFANIRTTLGEAQVGYNYAASSSRAGYSPVNTNGSSGDAPGWVSGVDDAPSDTEWLELVVPAGLYTEVFLSTEASGQEMWVAVKPSADATFNGEATQAGEWVQNNTGGFTVDGVPFQNHFPTLDSGASRRYIGGTLSAPNDGTVIRLYFRNLSDHLFDSSGNAIAVNGYVANVFRYYALEFGSVANALASSGDTTIKAKGWVLCDDATDVVRVMFMWAGFHQMNIDLFGYSLAQPMQWGQDKFFMDAINDIAGQANWIFYMGPPTADDMSIGVPNFVKQQAVTLQPTVSFACRDTDLLEALDVQWDTSELPYATRVRGKINANGVTFGQDLSKRYMGTYYPPWSGQDYRKVSPIQEGHTYDNVDRLSGLKRNYVATQGASISLSLDSVADCVFAAVLTAVQFALAETTATLQTAGRPLPELNTAVTVQDEGSATNSRVWVNSIESDHTMGENGSWHITVTGALLDTIDLNLIAEDWTYVVAKYTLGHAVGDQNEGVAGATATVAGL